MVAIGFLLIALEIPVPGPLAALLPATDVGWSRVVWSAAVIGGGAAAVLIIPSRSPVWIGALLALCLTVGACAVLTGGDTAASFGASVSVSLTILFVVRGRVRIRGWARVSWVAIWVSLGIMGVCMFKQVADIRDYDETIWPQAADGAAADGGVTR